MPFVAIKKNNPMIYSSIDLYMPELFTCITQEQFDSDDFYCRHCDFKFASFPHCDTKENHFRHPDGVKCTYRNHDESPRHMRMKGTVYGLLKLNNDLEYINFEEVLRFNGKHRKADIYLVTKTGIKVAVECQNTRKGTRDFSARTKFYNDNGIYVLWVINSNYCDIGTLKNGFDIEKARLPELWLNHRYGNCIYIFDDFTRRLNIVNLNQDVILKDMGDDKSWTPNTPVIENSLCSVKILESGQDYIINPKLGQEQNHIPFFQNRKDNR